MATPDQKLSEIVKPGGATLVFWHKGKLVAIGVDEESFTGDKRRAMLNGLAEMADQVCRFPDTFGAMTVGQ